MSKLVFMSAAHVARMNELLAADAGSRAACAALDRTWHVVYELSDGAQTVWWTMRFDPACGVSFDLAPPAQPADLLFKGGHAATLRWMRAQKAGAKDLPEPFTLHGDPAGLAVIGPAYGAAHKAAAIDTEIPDV